jgi:prepilin-type N-terminal cleavage/methylation domain-containing protein
MNLQKNSSTSLWPHPAIATPPRKGARTPPQTPQHGAPTRNRQSGLPSPHATARHSRLIELLVVMAIIAIFASFRDSLLPGLIASTSCLQRRQRLCLRHPLCPRRSHAARENRHDLQKRRSGRYPPKCSSTATGLAVGGWMEGWVVFVDETGTVRSTAASDTVLRVQQASREHRQLSGGAQQCGQLPSTTATTSLRRHGPRRGPAKPVAGAGAGFALSARTPATPAPSA